MRFHHMTLNLIQDVEPVHCHHEQALNSTFTWLLQALLPVAASKFLNSDLLMNSPAQDVNTGSASYNPHFLFCRSALQHMKTRHCRTWAHTLHQSVFCIVMVNSFSMLRIETAVHHQIKPIATAHTHIVFKLAHLKYSLFYEANFLHVSWIVTNNQAIVFGTCCVGRCPVATSCTYFVGCRRYFSFSFPPHHCYVYWMTWRRNSNVCLRILTQAAVPIMTKRDFWLTF